MKKNVFIIALAVICGCFAYLGICEHKEKENLKLELELTQKALYAVGDRLEELQYLDEWTNDPTEGKAGLYKYQDFYGRAFSASDEYKMRVNCYGIDIPMWFNKGLRSARIADSYNGFEWDKVLIEFK